MELPATLPEAFAEDVRRYDFGGLGLWDAPPSRALPDDVQRAVNDYADRQVDAVQRTIFPLHRL